jgi:hypothetical protein
MRDFHLLIGVLLLVTGCGAGTVWVKEGATAQDFERDKFDCEQRVVTMYGGYAHMDIGQAIVAGNDLRRCLRVTHGWREATEMTSEP